MMGKFVAVGKNINHTEAFPHAWIQSVVYILLVEAQIKHIYGLIKTRSSHVAILVIKCSFVYLTLFNLLKQITK